MNWRKPQKIYYPRASTPDLLLEESPLIQQKKYNANSICEWNIDGMSDYNIITILQQMIMVNNAYRVKLNSLDEVVTHLLIVGLTDSLKLGGFTISRKNNKI